MEVVPGGTGIIVPVVCALAPTEAAISANDAKRATAYIFFILLLALKGLLVFDLYLI